MLLFSAGDGAFDVDHIKFNGDKIEILSAISSINWRYQTTALYRDPSSWYHITVAVDTTNSTASDRVKIYVNGTRVEDFNVSTAPSQNYQNNISSTKQHAVGYDVGNIGYTFAGYMADVFFIDGSQLDPTSFGAFDDNGVWQAAAYSGSFGTNGFHLLDFANESTVGHDSSGNNNDFTANNISTTAGAGNDVLFDVPVNGTASDTGAGGEVNGNYATLNAVAPHGLTISNGNLDGSGSVIQGHAPSTIFASSGKFYCEFTLTTYQNDTGVGVAASIADPGEDWIGEQAYMIGYLADGRIFQNSSSTSYSSYAAGDVIGAAFDVATGKVWFHKNGTYQNSGDPAAGTGQVGTITGGYALGFTFRSVGGAGSFNFGQRAFAYSAPSGFKALCTTNLPTPTIANGRDYFDAALYTGNGSTQNITSLNFNPDWVWVKCRNAAQYHRLVDSVRGVNKDLITNGTFGEQNQANSNSVSAFKSNGFSLGPDGAVNTNNNSYVAWTWDAGSSSAASNTDGGITSSVKVNSDAGFSIGTYTGTGSIQTVGTGLSNTKMVILKNRDSSSNWVVYHKIVDGSYDFMYLNNGNGNSNSGLAPFTMNNTFKVGTNTDTNGNNDDFVFYAFSPVAGYSAFGTYEGNGSADGPFIHTGFRVAFLLQKRTDSSGSWAIKDAAREPYNVVDTRLYADSANADMQQASFHNVDFLSNGFKVKSPGGSEDNANGATYLYAAFSENPFQANGGLAR